MSPPRVLSLGNAVVDLVAAVPRLPDRGGDLLASGGLVPGGSGLLALSAARAVGVRAAFAGRVGTGPFGDLLRAAFAERGVDLLLPRVEEADSGVAITLLEPDGERTFVTLRGAEAAAPLLDRVEAGPGDLVHVSGYALLERGRAEEVLRFLRALPASVPLLLDPGPLGDRVDATTMDALVERADWWSGTAAEAAAATAEPDPERAAAALARRTRSGAVVRMGPAGCVVALDDDAPVTVPAPSVVALDTNG
ncbi:MAG: hypothetical protein QOE37_1249, partial [Microbacteriaceae bacterium]|nr:hypothetical protein [Microbacteriaceae bacterium]